MGSLDQADGAGEAAAQAIEFEVVPAAEVEWRNTLVREMTGLASRAVGGTAATAAALHRLATVPEAKPVRVCCTTFRQPRVYIAGPMRGIAALNAEAFFRAHYEWAAAGWQVLNPVLMDLEKPLITEEDLPDREELVGSGSSPNFRLLVLRDLDAISQKADAIAFLQGHQYSEGATAEWHVACWLNLPFYYQNEDGSWR